VKLRDRVGESFSATVIEVDKHGTVVQIADPAVRARAKIDGAAPGDEVTIVLRGVDIATRHLTLTA
jgi:exoribonuclease R